MKTLFTYGEAGTLIVFPKIQTLMTGVQSVFSAHPRYRLNYSDGSFEDAVCEKLTVESTCFEITSAVQAQRRGGAL